MDTVVKYVIGRDMNGQFVFLSHQESTGFGWCSAKEDNMFDHLIAFEEEDVAIEYVQEHNESNDKTELSKLMSAPRIFIAPMEVVTSVTIDVGIGSRHDVITDEREIV